MRQLIMIDNRGLYDAIVQLVRAEKTARTFAPYQGASPLPKRRFVFDETAMLDAQWKIDKELRSASRSKAASVGGEATRP